MRVLLLVLGLVSFLTSSGRGQQWGSTEITFMFYNVENLFDIRDDSLTIDEAFLPDGDRHWTYGRFLQKLNHIYKVIAGVGRWQPPAVIGLAEVENRYVLEGLLQETPLHRFGYEIIHQDSPDARGIDVALLYRPNLFEILQQEFIPVELPSGRKTRDILYVRGTISQQDTVHLYVNHWPSRYSGTKLSEPSRLIAAETLKTHVKNIIATNPDAKILITGDFNDSPEDASIQHLLEESRLRNISTYELEGTHKHQGEWGVLDQWLASDSWFSDKDGCYIQDEKSKVFSAKWLLEEDIAHMGYKPRRTYVGFKYQGGFSDHLPVYISIKLQSLLGNLND
jgi:endonuclease/exonuclease/phosphatase family metal-dependent hydrolase